MSETAPEPREAAPGDPTGCAVEAHGVVRVPLAEIAALRKAPGPLGARKIPPSLLKHADHQTVLGLAALLRALDDHGWTDRSFHEWGLVAAPRFLGRVTAAVGIDRFKKQGPTGMSPLIIPTMSLHAVAGSLSLALKTHGFNYGVGGSDGHLAEALLTGLASRDDNGVPGVWVVVTQFDPEPAPDGAGKSAVASVGYAVALALSAAAPARSRLNLRFVPTFAVGPARGWERGGDPAGSEPAPPLVALAEFLTGPTTGPRPRKWHCPLPGGGAIALDDDPARAAGGARSAMAG